MKTKTAVYAGSFDPITLGHLNIAIRGASLVDKLIIAVGENPKKKYMFDLETRIRLIQESVCDYPNIEVTSFHGLLVDFCRTNHVGIILRGLRAATDFDFEFQIGLANMDMAPEVETVFLLSEPNNIFISSSLVKEIAFHGGNVEHYLPPPTLKALMSKVKTKE